MFSSSSSSSSSSSICSSSKISLVSKPKSKILFLMLDMDGFLLSKADALISLFVASSPSAAITQLMTSASLSSHILPILIWFNASPCLGVDVLLSSRVIIGLCSLTSNWTIPAAVSKAVTVNSSSSKSRLPVPSTLMASPTDKALIWFFVSSALS